MKIQTIENSEKGANKIFLAKKNSQFGLADFSSDEINYIQNKLKEDKKQLLINRFTHHIYICILDEKYKNGERSESLRKSANYFLKNINKNKYTSIEIISKLDNKKLSLSFVEGLVLSNYQFINYFNEPKKKQNSLSQINIVSNEFTNREIDNLQLVLRAVYYTRNLVNEPVSHLNAPQLADKIKELGEEANFTAKVLEKSEIKKLGMGGLLAVNKGSIDPPRFSILEWKPDNCKNQQPYVLVGKGVVYDTGGLSLKPTSNSMDSMKSDMAGAAAVVGAIYAIASAKLPLHIIGLIPSTDNRPDGNAYAPGDIVKMHNGLHVEVLNTDAEGRMILADALSYAQQYKPKLVLNLATLTGSAAVAIGKNGIVAMGNTDKDEMDNLKQSGDNVFERIVEFPFWDDYNEYLKSDIADLKNIGGREAGAITAGKFLEHFTRYPFIHIDIAGTAFLDTEDNYRGKGATGIGVRLLFDFFLNKCM